MEKINLKKLNAKELLLLLDKLIMANILCKPTQRPRIIKLQQEIKNIIYVKFPKVYQQEGFN